MTLLMIFVVGYVSVFLLGFQSRSVNSGNYGLAAGGSFLIALSQVGIWQRLTDPASGWLEAVVYGLSGATGITSSMWVHKRFVKPKT